MSVHFTKKYTCRVGSMYDEWMSAPEPDTEAANPVDVNLKYQTYCNAMAEGGEAEWDFGWARYQSSQVATEKATLLYSLTCARDVWLLNRYLNMSLHSDSGVRLQDSYKVIGGVGGGTVGRYVAWDFLRANWDQISKL